jgi:hypothetical protein
MKKVLLQMVLSALLVTLGLAQTPGAGSNTDQINVKGCLGGSEGSYTVAEDGTSQIFKITTSSVDLKPHLGHDVQLTGQKANGATASGGAGISFAVTELKMISEQCAAAAAAPAAAVIAPAADAPAPPATVNPSTVTVTTPAANPAAPAAAVSPASVTVTTAAANPAVPAAAVSPASVTVTTAAANPAAPAGAVSPASVTVTTPAAVPAVIATPSSEAVSAPAAATPNPSSPTIITEAADEARPTRLSAHHRKLAATQAAAATVPSATVSPAADTASPTSDTASAPSATVSPSADAASAPATAPVVTHKGISLWLLVLVGVLVIGLAALAPRLFRWRKRKALEQTGTPNLSFTNEASSDQEKTEPRKVA